MNFEAASWVELRSLYVAQQLVSILDSGEQFSIIDLQRRRYPGNVLNSSD